MNASSIAARQSSFGGLDIAFDARVLEPRAWTELHSDWAAELAATSPAGPLLELCAGAGHIGLLAAVRSGRDLVQVEADDVAAGYARRNAAAAGHPVDVRNVPMSSALAAHEVFPVVIADPPYLPSRDVARWPGDPVRAIDGGPDGMDLVRGCLTVAADHLAARGPLLLQVAGDAQVDAVCATVRADPASPFAYEQTRRHDTERAVVLLRRA